MKRYPIIATVLVAILLTVFTGGALAQGQELTVDMLGKALAELA